MDVAPLAAATRSSSSDVRCCSKPRRLSGPQSIGCKSLPVGDATSGRVSRPTGSDGGGGGGAEVRVLEGLPPKAPKVAADQSDLFRSMRDVVPTWSETMTDAGSPASVLRGPFYFIACDAALRDFLLWPLLRVPSEQTVTDPTADYFRLWSAGVKWRVFTEDRVDFYIPRNNTAVAAPPVV